MKKSICILALLLAGCASNEAPPYEINNKQFYENVDEQGNKIFAYVVSVKAEHRSNINLNNGGRGEKRPSRSDVKRYIEQEYFEDSSVLKLKLEDEAVRFLNETLSENNYCENKHEITQVLWRDLSVQLRGRCL